MFATWIDLLSISLAFFCMAIAAYVDCRTMRIPNRLTLPFILSGIGLLAFRCFFGSSIIEAFLTCLISYLYVYALWRCGLWGGGDAKATLAIFLLLSPVYPPLMFMAGFSVCLSIALFTRHFLIEAIYAMVRGKLRAIFIASLPVSIFLISFILLSPHGSFIAFIGSFLAIAIISDVMSAYIPYSERIVLDAGHPEQACGRVLAEDIYLIGDTMTRKSRPPGFFHAAICHILDRRSELKPLLPCRKTGLTKDDICMLNKYTDSVEVIIQRPMGPALLFSLLLSLPFTCIFPGLILS
ncbi:prepilin peptidase [Methanooceanicella nereidis]|uniref:prepilin peptidase n=1 Tax=Methanooceanicella nereidis TaxID=2052831 RepID=UPI001E47E9D1|nr:A24 family peptidase [Methanocella sp. CWC-04]